MIWRYLKNGECVNCDDVGTINEVKMFVNCAEIYTNEHRLQLYPSVILFARMSGWVKLFFPDYPQSDLKINLEDFEDGAILPENIALNSYIKGQEDTILATCSDPRIIAIENILIEQYRLSLTESIALRACKKIAKSKEIAINFMQKNGIYYDPGDGDAFYERFAIEGKKGAPERFYQISDFSDIIE